MRPELGGVRLERFVRERRAMGVGDPAGLLAHRVGDRSTAVPDVDDDRPAGGVEVGPALRRPRWSSRLPGRRPADAGRASDGRRDRSRAESSGRDDGRLGLEPIASAVRPRGLVGGQPAEAVARSQPVLPAKVRTLSQTRPAPSRCLPTTTNRVPDRMVAVVPLEPTGRLVEEDRPGRVSERLHVLREVELPGRLLDPRQVGAKVGGERREHRLHPVDADALDERADREALADVDPDVAAVDPRSTRSPICGFVRDVRPREPIRSVDRRERSCW